MPTVKGKHFSYDAKGRKAAMAEAARTGQPVVERMHRKPKLQRHPKKGKGVG